MEVWRRLAQADPVAFELDLARSLWTFALQTEPVEALGSIRESVAVYRRLATQIRGAFNSDLGASLGTAADVLDGLGRQEDAISLRRLVRPGRWTRPQGCFRK